MALPALFAKLQPLLNLSTGGVNGVAAVAGITECVACVFLPSDAVRKMKSWRRWRHVLSLKPRDFR